MMARSPSDKGILGSAEDFASSICENGTIGFEGDPLVYDELGSAGNDGHTLIKVTLYKGKDPDEPVKKGVAQGHPVMCRLKGDGFWRIPKHGERCIVLFPGGDIQTPGNGVIVACPDASPTVQFKESRAVLDFGPDTDVIIKGRSVTLSDYADHPNALQVGSVLGGEDLIKLFTGNGDFFSVKAGAIGMAVVLDGDAKSMFVMETDSIAVTQKSGGSSSKWKGGKWQTVVSGQISLIGASVGFGASPSVPIVIGPSGMAGIGSTCLFGTP